MAVSLRYVVGQLSVVDEVRRSHADNILAVSPGSFPTSPRNGFGLYALLELSGLVPPPPGLQQQLLSIVQTQFYQSSGSVSLSLQQAVAKVNEALFDFNLNSVRDERQGGGITCVAIRDDEVYLVQGGPAVAYVGGGGQIVRFPTHSPWFDEDVPEEALPRPLGASRQIAADISHGQLRAGNWIVLAESLLGQVTSTDQVKEVLFPGEIELTTERLADLVGDDDMSLLVIETRTGVAHVEEPAYAAEPYDESDDFEAVTELPAPAAARKATSRRRPAVGQRSAQGISAAVGAFLANAGSWIDWPGIGRHIRGVFRALWGYVLVALDFVWNNLKILAVRVLPGSWEIDVQPKQHKVAVPKPREETPRQERPKMTRPGSRRSTIFKYVAVAIPIIVLLIVGGVYLERERAAYDTHAQLIQAAKARYDQALSSMADVARARSLMTEALGFLDQAKASLPSASDSPDLRKNILETMDKINQVKRVYWIPMLQQFSDPQTDLGRIVVDGINIYLLDHGTNQVLGYVLNETETGFVESGQSPVLLAAGDQLEDVVVGDLLDMTWMPVGGGRQTGGLTIVDKQGALFDYGAMQKVTHRPLAATDEWRYAQLIAGFFGNLYVLDVQRNQLLKYLPTAADGGYSNPPVDYLNADAVVDLSGAVDMAIDGHIYVLYANGTIGKFMSGDPVAFEVTGLDVPLNNPSALFANADDDTQYLYVADRGNQRIVQLTKDGSFQRQFKVDSDSNAFDDLRSLWVDELEQKMYIVSGKSVYITNLLAE